MKAVRNYQINSQPGTYVPVRHGLAARLAFLLFAAIIMLPLCAAQQTNTQRSTEAGSALADGARHKIIYVRDFELDHANFKQDKGGITGKGYLLPAPPKSFLRRKHQDPAKEAEELVELMSVSLVRDLQNAGFTAWRLSSMDPTPKDGLVVTGVFTELDEGNQMRRALFGFGSGKAKMQLYVMAAHASSTEPLYETSAQKTNGKAPGAAIALNPYAGAAGLVVKFGMTKNAPEKMVKQTASKIATELTKQLNAASSSAGRQEPARTALQMATSESK
jgi:Domain of unknown function (DUF4410)